MASLIGKEVQARSLLVDAPDANAILAALRNANRIGCGLTAVPYNVANERQQYLFIMTDAEDAEIESDLAVNSTRA